MFTMTNYDILEKIIMQNPAVVVTPTPANGYPTTLHIKDTPIPSISDDEVLIQIKFNVFHFTRV